MFTARMGPRGIYTADIQLIFKKNDLDYIIYSITGTVRYINNIKECYPRQKKIASELKKLFPNAKMKTKEENHSSDKTGKSKTKTIEFIFLEKDTVYVACYDWSKKMGYNDHLRIAIDSKEFNDWLRKEAY